MHSFGAQRLGTKSRPAAIGIVALHDITPSALDVEDGVLSVTNLGSAAVPLPAHREVLLASTPVDDLLPPDSTVWLAL